METCELCGQTLSLGELFSVSNQGKKTFECKDEVACRKLTAEHRALKAAKAKTERAAAFREKFGVDLCDLVELTPRMRDASIHYYDPRGNRIFTQALWEPNGELKLNTNDRLRVLFGLPKN
jgi:hypothetical protein